MSHPALSRERPRDSSPHHLSPYIHHFPNPSCAAHIGVRAPCSAPRARFCPSSRSGGSSPPLTTRPLGAPLPPQLLAVRRPFHALHPRRSRRRPRMASSWRIWPARILLLWLRRPRRHRRHAAIAAVASPAIGAGARSRSITVLCAAPHRTSQRGSPPRALHAPLLFASLSHRWPRCSRALAPRFRPRANFNPPPAQAAQL